MEQYKVILVDDEVEVIDVMKKKIRWNDLGFDVVGSATNGVKALELVEKLQPDVVLTDIKMLILCQEKVQIKNDFFPSCQHT